MIHFSSTLSKVARFSFALFLFLPYILFSQVGTLNLVTPVQSPTAAALGKYIDLPVGHYNGIPNISVPLFETDIKGLSLSIALSYHASGLKVKDVPGPVGAGWSLQAGGMITRITKGHPDTHDPFETPFDADDDNDSIVKKRVAIAYEKGGMLNYEFTELEMLNIALSTRGVTAINFPFVRMDTEIDLYYFNFLGHTGQFTFTNEGKPMLLSGSGMKIEQYNRSFKLTDEKGTEFYFEHRERALDEGSNIQIVTNPNGRYYTTSWFLTRVRIPQYDQEVHFSYVNYSVNDLTPGGVWNLMDDGAYSRVDKFRFNYQINHSIGLPNTTTYGMCPPHTINQPSLQPLIHSNNLFLDEITWNGNKIKFYGSNVRSDMYKFRYDSVKVMAGNQLISKIDLKYSYFNPNAPSVFGRKLKLDTIIKADQKFSFSYYESHFGKTVPGILFKGHDLWGFYNGEDDEAGIPYYKAFDDPNLHQSVKNEILSVAGKSSMKSPDNKYAQLGSLKSITYPTGGKTVFEYEGNDYSFFPFIKDGKTIETDDFTQFKFDSTTRKSTSANTDLSTLTGYDRNEREFVMHKDQTASLFIQIGANQFNTLEEYTDLFYNYYSGGGASASACLQKFNVLNGQFENVELFEISPIDSIGLPLSQYEYDEQKLKGTKSINKTLFLSEGRYKIISEVYGNPLYSNIRVEGVFPYLKKTGVYNAGGLRIKKIEMYDGIHVAPALVKSYKYESGSVSSGILESPFSNLSTSAICDDIHLQEQNGVYLHFQEAAFYYNFTSNPVIPLGNAKGGIIGYARVEEIAGNKSKTVYHFTNGQDDPEFYADMFVESYFLTRNKITTDNSWKRGLPKLTEYFDSSGAVVKKEFSEYKYDTSSVNYRSISMSMIDVNLQPGAPYENIEAYQASESFTYSGMQQVLKVKDSSVLYTSSGPLSETSIFKYHTNSYPHIYPLGITRLTSAGDSIVTHMKYPQDYSFATATSHPVAQGIKNLQTSNTVSVPVESYVLKKSNGAWYALSGQFIQYKPTVPLPDTMFILRTSIGLANYQPVQITPTTVTMNSAYMPALYFSRYDNRGNVVEQAKANDNKEVFLWGYLGQYPVAKIIGSDYNTVSALVDLNILNNPASEVQLLTELNKIRTHFQNSTVQVSTYAFDPLKGLTAEVNPRGQKTTYTYDSWGRLIQITDHEGKILKMFKYIFQELP